VADFTNLFRIVINTDAEWAQIGLFKWFCWAIRHKSTCW